MGLDWKKWIPNEVKEVFKPVAKAAKKFIPKEARPFIPMLTPFLPAMGIMGQLGGPMGFAKMYGANLLGQQLADPDAEFDDLNQLAALLSGTQGGLTNTGTAQNLRDMTTRGKFDMSPYAGSPSGSAAGSDALAKTLSERSMLTKAKDLGLTGLAEASDYLTDTTETLQKLGSGEAIPIKTTEIVGDKIVKDTIMKDLFTKEGAKALAKSAAVPFATGMGGVSEAYARPAMREFEKQEAADLADWEEGSMIEDQKQADLTMKYYRAAGHDEETIKTAMDLNDIGHLYEPPVEEEESAAQGGIIGLKEGGMLNFGGREMDLRTGGFVPIGRQERADDVPARLSKNEFVMTADAVRAAGGGSVNKGAQRMYDIMNKLEARA